MRYSTLLLDLDHTLFDSAACEVVSFESTLRAQGVEDPLRHLSTYVAINESLWKSVERGERTPQEVHVARFERLVTTIRLDADPGPIAEAYAAGLGANGELFPGARDVIEQLAGQATLALVTNGLSEVQRARIERLDLEQYFDAVVISAEIGVAKPSREIFDAVFDALDFPDKETALMVGDSLSSDIRGGADYGIATCWYNPHGKTAGADDGVSHEITHLEQLPALARGDQADASPS